MYEASHLKMRVRKIMGPNRGDNSLGRKFDGFIVVLILLNVIAVILETVSAINLVAGGFFFWFEVFSVAVFTVEYLGRIWACTSLPEYSHPIMGRLKFAIQPLNLIDLMAILPFYFAAKNLDGRVVRALRLYRIIRIVKLARYTAGFSVIGRVLKNKKEELLITASLMLMLLIISSTFVYYLEMEAQPEAFSSIPAAMWWASSTLTTVGYGDIYPITIGGRFFAVLAQISSIGIFALPTGILGAGFVAEMNKVKGVKQCPYCGHSLPD